MRASLSWAWELVEAFNICRLSGVDPHVFATTVADSGPQRSPRSSVLFRDLARKVLEQNYVPTFGLGLLQKDNHLALQLAHAAGSSAFVVSCVDHLDTVAANQGWATEDTAAVYKLYRLLSAEETSQ